MINSKLQIVGCQTCKHFDNATMRTCKAFPKGIPAPILQGDVDHRESYPGDNGIHWEYDIDAQAH